MAINFKKIMEERDTPAGIKKHNIWLANSLTRNTHFDLQVEWKYFETADDVHSALKCLSEIPEADINMSDWEYLINHSCELSSVNITQALKKVKDTIRRLEE